jgi:hypothetical protein
MLRRTDHQIDSFARVDTSKLRDSYPSIIDMAALIFALLARAGTEAKIGCKVHPRLLQHSCGYALANKRDRYRDTAGLSRPSLD